MSTVAPSDPAPGLTELTQRLHEAYTYGTNVFMRDCGSPDPRTLWETNEVAIPDVGSAFETAHPAREPSDVMEDENVRVTATLVPRGPVHPSFAFRFDTEYMSVTFSGDAAETENLVKLARGSDILVHEAFNVRGLQHDRGSYGSHV